MIWSGSIWSDKMALQIKQGVNVAQVMIRLFPFSDVMIGLHLHLPQTLRFADDPCLWIVYRFHMPLFWTNSGSMIKYFFYNQDSYLWILSYVWITQNNSSEQSIICMTIYYSIILSEMSSLMRSISSSVTNWCTTICSDAGSSSQQRKKCGDPSFQVPCPFIFSSIVVLSLCFFFYCQLALYSLCETPLGGCR